MRASECPSEQMPIARYPCENQACIRQSTWLPEELRWSQGGDDGHGTAWPPGFYCRTCQDAAPHGAGKNAPTLAEEMARRTGVVGERADTANIVKMQLVGTLVCIPFEMPQDALLEVALVDEDGKRECRRWHLSVGYEWPESECLPGDLVNVEGHLTADGDCDPLLMVSRVRLLRQDIAGEPREQLLKCEDTVERWERARRFLLGYPIPS